MLGTSICPNCEAIFTVNESQISAHLGLVRCEECLELFDFRISYVPAHHSPQLNLPIADERVIDTELSTEDRIKEALTAARQREIFGEEDFIGSQDAEVQYTLTEDINEPETHNLQALQAIEQHVIPEEFSEEETQLSPTELDANDETSPEVEYEFAKKSYRAWPWAVGSCLTLLTLFLQAAYFFRVEIAANFPATKSSLMSACALLNCTVDLPQKANLMSIESSDLADVQSHVVLNALLRNHAGYAQAFPNLELTFTDTLDNPQARRIFKPADYLPATENEAIGLLSNREINIKLHINTADSKPSGYRLMLLYPQ